MCVASSTDPLSEVKSNVIYIPRDEAFSEVKQLTFSAKTLRSVLHAFVPFVETAIIDKTLGFPHFTAIDSLYNEGMSLPRQEGVAAFRTIIPRVIKAIKEGAEDVLQFEVPAMVDSKHSFSLLTAGLGSFLCVVPVDFLLGTVREIWLHACRRQVLMVQR